MDPRPKIIPERLRDKEITQGDVPQFPHCDSFVLHAPEECEYCRNATKLQIDRKACDVSYTGHFNRKYQCPSTERRKLSVIHAWPGNRPQDKP